MRVPCIEKIDPIEARPGWTGKLRDPHTSLVHEGTIHCYDPATGYVLGTVPADTPTTIRAKIEDAVDAQRIWSKSSMAQRRRVLQTLHAWIQRDLSLIARMACRDTGKTAIDAAFGELLTTCSKLVWTLKHGERVLRPERRSGNLLLAHKTCTVHHEPLGLVVACVSWNYPVHNMLGPIISALFAGNAIVVKGSEHVAWSSQLVLEGVRRCLAACGAPTEAVQLVLCGPEAVEALTRDPRIAHITFIGSDAVGRRVAAAAAPQLTPTTLELGGKDPAIVLPDTHMEFFASMFLRACFQAMGQNCIGIERFIVPRSRIDELVALVRPRIEALRAGSALDETRFGTGAAEDAVDVGAMISDARFDTLEALIAEAVAQGAQLHTGGRRLVHARWPLGHYFAPTLLTHVTPAMRIAQEELFAPVFLVMAYDTVEEAVRMANGTPFGLGASVFGRSRTQCRRVAAQLECGMVNINEYVLFFMADAALASRT
ncbi:Meiotic Sister-Chromatid recombination aldehyde dehydrogenase [Malassezia nana]|uniref:Meiotic Sister-Chromatid recombination aldehyde dehydrogenase n=1 Tax=Malassezia nana TaxID=180528 RepID=A0AAF0EJY2_9BASI|nr:Meiotic Sister-Chromatid recombination aldehyde dehydrogenase [Malassezia nana]